MSFHKQSAAHIYFMINCFDSLIWSSLRNKYYYYCSSITLYTVDATEYVTAQIDATFHEVSEECKTVS